MNEIGFRRLRTMTKQAELKGYIVSNFTTQELRNIAKRVSCTYVKRDNIIKSSNFELCLDTFQATSWEWWDMLRIVDGKLVRNTYNYSNSTAKHQNKLYRILDSLGIKSDVVVSWRNGRSGRLYSLSLYCDELNYQIKQNLFKIYTPRTWKSTKEKLNKENRYLFNKIQEINNTFDLKTKVVSRDFFRDKTLFYKRRIKKAQNNSPLWKTFNGAA